MSNFAMRLRDILKNKHVTPYALSRKSRIPQATISRYLSDTRKPTFENVLKIAKALNISLSYFDDGIDYNELLFSKSVFEDDKIIIIIPKYDKNYAILNKKLLQGVQDEN